jgi:single-stranded DNA-binding protein
MNEVTLTGYLASVPCRTEHAGAVSLRFSLVTLTDATPLCSTLLHRYDWYHVKAFGDVARAAAGLTLGQRVRVRGWLRTERMFHDGYNVYLASI